MHGSFRLFLAGAMVTMTASCVHISAADQSRPLPGRTYFDVLPQVVGYPPDGAVLGQAYDLVLQRKLPTICVRGASGPLGAGDLQAQYSDLHDREQLFESLKVSASASFGGAGSLGGSASVDYSKSVKIEHERRNILATINLLRGGEQMVPASGASSVRLTSDARAIANKSAGNSWSQSPDTQAFRKLCGDGYVAAVRSGSRLNLVFSYAMDSSEIKETLNAQASGSYGPISAKAGIDRIREDKKNSKRTHVSVFQLGGNQQKLPVSAQEALEMISGFGSFEKDSAVPLELVVVPYRVLPDYPDALRVQPLPDAGVRGLAAHYWRLSDLSALYARATAMPRSYYHAFLPQDGTARGARVLREAARCVAAMADRCAQEGKCTLEGLLEIEAVRNSCGATNKARIMAGEIQEDEVPLILSLVVGTPGADMSRERRRGIDAWWKHANEAHHARVRDRQKADSPYDVYYAYLARTPWLRSVNEKGVPDSRDFTKLVEEYCRAQLRDCDVVNLNKLGDTLNSGELENAKKIFSSFIINHRLASVSAAICEQSLSHPMCQLPDDLPIYLKDRFAPIDINFGPERGFIRPAASPPPAPEPTPHEPWDPCPGPHNYSCI